MNNSYNIVMAEKTKNNKHENLQNNDKHEKLQAILAEYSEIRNMFNPQKKSPMGTFVKKLEMRMRLYYNRSYNS